MERWERELKLVEEGKADPYGKYQEMETFRDRFRNAMERDGVDAYLVKVLTEQADASEEDQGEEYKACWDLNVARVEMSRLIDRAREIQENWSKVASEAAFEAERGLPDLEKYLAVSETDPLRPSEAWPR